MKRTDRFRRRRAFHLLLGFCGLILPGDPARCAAQGFERPEEEAIVIPVDAGVRRVRVQVRDAVTGQWLNYAMAHLDGRAGKVKMRIPAGLGAVGIRVSVSASEDFPCRFFMGAQAIEDETIAPALAYDKVARWPVANADRAARPGDVAEGSGAAVVESDIWKLSGDRLFFFNQYRGLQVFDLSRPGSPRHVASLRLPAVGEQLYVLDDGHAVLLSGPERWGGPSEVVIARADAASAEVSARLKVDGAIVESRMVGAMLYLVTEQYQNVPVGDALAPQWLVKVWAIDLANASAPTNRAALDLASAGYRAVVTATPTDLLVSTRRPDNYAASIVHAIDIRGPSQGLSIRARVDTAGYVADKFKLQLSGDVLTAVSEVTQDGWRTRFTTLETFALNAAPKGVTKLGELSLGRGEQLYATRLVGDRAYIVTFFQIDPLWIVDLSDPRAPSVSAELQIPGWSTYLEPIDTRLLAIGVETGRVTVSLFDVSDPASPSMLDREYVGDQYSWSEANYDEKAVSVLRGEGLVLVPFESYGTGGAVRAVQLVDLSPDALALRGRIEHTFQPRRAASLGAQHLVSISGKELVVVDASDRDTPDVVARLDISWTVDRVFVSGDYLLQIENGASWDAGSRPGVRVSSRRDPDTALFSTNLGLGYVLGSAVKGDRLYTMLAPVRSFYDIGIQPLADGPAVRKGSPTWELKVFDLKALPAIAPLGSATVDATGLYASELRPLWLSETEMLWSLVEFGGGWHFLDRLRGRPTLDFVGGIPWYQDRGVSLVAFDVSDPIRPRHLSTVRVASTNGWSFTAPVLEGGKAFVSGSLFAWDNVSSNYLGGERLYVVDYTVATNPVVRAPVRLPAPLVGVIGQGPDAAILLTSETRFLSPSPTQTLWECRVQASAYDGLDAYRIDELTVPGGEYTPLVAAGAVLYKMRRSMANDPFLTPISWDPAGRLETHADVPLRFMPTEASAEPGLLLMRDGANLAVADLGQPQEPTVSGPFNLPSGVWAPLDRCALDGAVGLWMPAGFYGAAFVDFGARVGGKGAPGSWVGGASEVPRAGVKTEWTDRSVCSCSLSRLDAQDDVGVLLERNWLFRPDGFAPLDPGAYDLGDAVRFAQWVGYYSELHAPWVYHFEHGWVYPQGDPPSSIALWMAGLEWVWTARGVYPFLYQYSTGAWLWYHAADPVGRWFYRCDTGEWAYLASP